MPEDAQKNFATARVLLQQECGLEDDAGILAAEGFLLERNHDITGAIEKYEKALMVNKYHEFTISNYAKLLRRRGNIEAADKLEERLSIENFDSLGESTDTFYSGFDIIDDGIDLYDD